MIRVYKIELMVVDHDDVGPQDVAVLIETTRYPSRCIAPRVMNVDERAVEWTDEHPLNSARGWQAAFRALFASGRERLIAEAALRWRDAKCAGAPECCVYEEDHGDKCPVTITTMALRAALEGWAP